MERRASGILLHVTSLPGKFGIGDFGPWAYRFAKFLQMAGQSYWQILPLTPTDQAHGNSPYHSCSAFALNPLFLSPELLVKWGWAPPSILSSGHVFSQDVVEYCKVVSHNQELIERIFKDFDNASGHREYEEFCQTNSHWLGDYALFRIIKGMNGGSPWTQWPPELRDRSDWALAEVRREHKSSLEKIQFVQFLLYKQWMALRAFCNEKGIRIFGDMPIYVVHDSADVWAHPELFNLDEDKRPITVAGVPPDYFSSTGQLWGNPVYRWDVLKATGYDWWIKRIRHNLALFDLVRVDHFRGFVGYWEVPAHEENAINGHWVEAPAWDFFGCVKKELGRIPIVAEDLGVITPDVTEVRLHFGLPGMKILLFAFGEDLPTNPYAPHNLERDCVVYTGTHDNNTARGWFENEIDAGQRQRIFKYLGREVTTGEISLALVRLAMMSVAKLSMFPMQDILGLGEEARMNRPARNEGNWQWRLTPDKLGRELAEQLREMTEIYGRI
ncbi:MAG: 4-alpha-glucanotransferase [Deltaproteobacteria bacterium]|nr:MAG: 4-alpha-glucanotransferase [Deltaproteobacteria bacterium]